MLLPLLLTLAAPEANAAKSGLHMWGAGPTLSTMAFPGSYPSSFPTVAKDDNKTPDPSSNLEKVRADIGLAARGVIYINNKNRVGVRLHRGIGLSANMANTVFTLEYEQSLIRQDNVNLFVGGGIGVGTLRFNQGDEGGDLKVNTYNTRIQLAGVFRDTHGKKNAADDRAYEIALYATPIGFKGPETYEYGDKEYTDPDSYSLFAAFTSDEGDNQTFRSSQYNPTIGIEATVLFGDLTPPGAGKKKKRNRNGRR